MNEIKYFTVKEANQMLPLLSKIVDDILRVGQEIRSISLKDQDKMREELLINQKLDELDDLFDEIEGLGCYYKDWNFSIGLVDFPAIIGDKEVFLCWRSDEEHIQYYHDAESGFAGRRLIPEGL